MPVERPLSARDPRVLLGFGISAGLALGAGLGLEVGVRHMLRELAWLPSDVAALRAAAWLTGLALFGGGICLILAATFIQGFRRAIAAERLPPPGPRAFGAVRTVTGRPAVLLGRVGMGLSAMLGLAGLALGGYSLWLVRCVVACAAKNL